MAKTFTLQLVNPDIKTSPQNVINTDTPGGNKLNLVLTNNFGYDLQFSGTPDTSLLLIKISKNVFDDKNFSLVSAASPWLVEGFYPPDQDPDPQDGKNYYILKLRLSTAELPFADGSSITVGLGNLNPTAKGNATVFAAYDFGVTTMNPSSQLAVLGAPKPGDKPLIGAQNALLLTTIVNGGGPTNPIVVTSKPVTAANAAENKLHLNFDFQDHNMPPAKSNLQTLGNLVPSWDPANPPTFRIQFPYFNATSQYPSPLDLTDDIKQGGADYNEYTSAWNIKVSLNGDDPSVTSNQWWTITLDPESPSPSWLIQPTAANKYLFTGTTSGPTGSGPFLDIFFSHIYSAMALDPSRPETLMYLETYDFPGFSDSFSQQPLFKEKSVQINGFSGQVKFIAGSAQLVLNWDTNADHCFVSGDSQQQAANTAGAPYTRNISVTQQLASSYTLLAVGKDGVSKLRRTIDVRWKEETSLTSAAFMYPTAIDVSPDGTSVYLAGTPDETPPPAILSILDGKTLVSSASQVAPSNGAAIMNVKASPDGSKLFLAALAQDGSTGYVLGYTTAAVPAPLPAKPAEPGFNSSVDLYPMAVSPDGAQIVISAPFTSGNDPFLAGYKVSDFKPSAGSPFVFSEHTGGNQLGPIGLAISGNTMFYPTFLGLGVMDRTTFKPVANSPISLKSDDKISYTPGPLAVSPDGKAVTTLAQGYINNQRAFILCRVDVASMTLTKRVQVNNGYPNDYWTPTTSLAYSIDGKYLFVFGMNYTPPAVNPPTTTLFSVYDADSLQEVSWSPLAVTKFYVAMVMAPDGSRIYVATLDSADGQSGTVQEMIPYFA
jgi:hypothetical protein